MAVQVFDRIEFLPDPPLLVCKQCQHAIWPAEVTRHFQGPEHRFRRNDIKQIEEVVEEHQELLRYPAQLEPRSHVEKRYEFLKLRQGYLCRRDPARCHFISCNLDWIRMHLSKLHYTSRYGRKGRPTKQQQDRQAILDQEIVPQVPVICQRFFPSRKGSEYFEVRQTDLARPRTADRIVPVWNQAIKSIDETFQAAEDEYYKTIEEGGGREVNQWLERTGWDRYLAGIEGEKLADCIVPPDREKEAELWMIWYGVERMFRTCQQTVVQRAGLYVRLEAMRSEKHQTRFKPLISYMNRAAIVKNSQPWKEMVMFIGRTRGHQECKKPKVKLQPRQKYAWRSLWRVAQQELSRTPDPDQSSEDSNDDLPQACFDFCWTLLEEGYRKHEYENVLVCALAVLGIQRSGRGWGWLGPDLYPPILSKIIKLARFMVVHKAIQDCDDDSSSSQDDSSSDGSGVNSGSNQGMPELEEPKKGAIGQVGKYMDQFMVRGTNSAMQWMLDLRTYGMAIHHNTTAARSIDWVGDQISWKGQIQLTMVQIREMIHSIVREARQVLLHDLMFIQHESELPVIPCASLRDQTFNGERGWSHLQDERNVWPVEGSTWLQNRIGAVTQLQECFMQGNEMNRAKVRKYLDQIVHFQALLLVLMHLTGGQPARGPEILTIQHCNGGGKGQVRNVFVDQNSPFTETEDCRSPETMVVFVTEYHKGYALTAKQKIIQRYLPRLVGELYVWYDWLVRPWRQKLDVFLRGAQSFSPAVWPMDHREKTWDTSRMSRVMERCGRRWIGVEKIGVRTWRDLAIAISRRYLKKEHAFRFDDEDEDGEEGFNEEQAEDILDYQAGHTPWVAGNVYARGVAEIKGVMATMRERYHHASQEWHRLLGLNQARLPETRKQKRKLTISSQLDQTSATIMRAKHLRRLDIVVQLQKMLGVDAKFRGQQQAAIQSIMRGDNCVVQVMGTGGGKSLSFMLPAWCSPGGTSIVVVPLVALRADMLARCKQLRISSAELDRQSPEECEGKRLVFVTPESAVGETFSMWMSRSKAVQQLDRIFIDECHVVLNEQTNFRRQLQELGQLTRVGVPIVLLTATLPPSSELELWRRMGWKEQQVRMFGSATRRVNIQYRTIRIEARGEELPQYVTRIQATFGRYSSGKAVVYCNTIQILV